MRVEGLQNNPYQNKNNDLLQNLNYEQKREIRNLLDQVPQEKKQNVINQIKELNSQNLDNQKYFNALKETIQNTLAQSQAASFSNFSLYA